MWVVETSCSLTSDTDVNTPEIQIPFFITSILLMYNFYKSWKTDPGVLKTSREEKVKVGGRLEMFVVPLFVVTLCCMYYCVYIA